MINRRLFIYDKLEKAERCYADLIRSEEELNTIITNFNEDGYIKLFNKDVNADADKKYLLEQYKLFSDTAETLVTRRQNMNSFYITANTALITIGATVTALSGEQIIYSKLLILLALSLPGFLLNFSWRRTLDSYFINNKGKMKILSMIEKRLPASLYDAEWKAMKNKYSKEKYVSFTDREKKLPLVFIVFFSVLDAAAIVFMLIKLLG